jgi:hypothetical protein
MGVIEGVIWDGVRSHLGRRQGSSRMGFRGDPGWILSASGMCLGGHLGQGEGSSGMRAGVIWDGLRVRLGWGLKVIQDGFGGHLEQALEVI